MGEQIALTGGTGFVGRHVLELLLEAGHRVRVLCRDPARLSVKPNLMPGLEIVRGGLGADDNLGEFVKGCDCVVHIAGLIKARNRAAFDAVNVAGTERLIDAVLSQAPDASFLLMSSLAARTPEVSDYAASKRAAEQVLLSSGIEEWHILRPPAVYGPGDRATLDLFRQFSRGRCLVPGNGRGRFSLIFVEDLARAVFAVVRDKPAPSCHDLHDGRVEGYAWQDLAGIAEEITGRRAKLLTVPRPLLMAIATSLHYGLALLGRTAFLSPGKVREFCHEDWVSRDNLLEEATAWRPEVAAEEGFATTLAWYRAQSWL